MHPRITLALQLLLVASAGCGGGDAGQSHDADAGDSDSSPIETGDERLDASSSDDDADSGMDAAQAPSSTLDADSVPDGDPAREDAAVAADGAGPKLRSVTIRFAGRVGTAEFACGMRYPGQGSTAVTITPVEFRFYVQDLKLVTASGDEVPVTIERRDPWQAEGVALIDLENATGSCLGTPEMNREITGYVPEGSYVGLRFTNGVPEALNHGDPTKLPPVLQVPGMQWNWLLGFRFVKAEVQQVLESGTDGGSAPADSGTDAGAAAGYGLMHAGAVACSGNPVNGDVQCGKPNRNAVKLDHFDPDDNVVAADLGALFGASDLTQDEECHGVGTACAPMRRLGIDVDTGQPLPDQQIYRVE